MDAQAALQLVLQTKFSEAKSKNPGFSLRAYSRRLGLAPGALSGILNGKRRVSETVARRISDRLGLDPQERSAILGAFPPKRAYRKRASAKAASAPDYLKVSAAQFRAIAEWEHLAILSLMQVRGFRASAEWIAARLGVSPKRVAECLARLDSAGMIRLAADGSFVRITPSIRTTDDVVDASVRRAHEETLELAKASLHRDSVAERDFTFVTLPVAPRNLALAKEKIRRFQDELMELVETPDATEVYRFSCQFFPLTKISTQGETP